MTGLWHPAVPLAELALRVVVVYAAVLVLLRLAGKKQVGQMGTAEFVSILLISNAVQNSMNGGDNSLTAGLFLAAVLVALSAFVSFITYRSRFWENAIQGRPRLLIHQGKILPRNLDKERLNPRELRVLLRRQGIHDFNEVEEAVLESDGYVSVLRRGEIKPEKNL